MSGLERIVDRISMEAGEKAAAILSEAEAKAAEITADGERKTREECERIEKKADSEAQNILSRTKASEELRTKQILLAGKQEVVKATLEAASGKLDSLTPEEYRDMFAKLFRKHVPAKSAVLRLGAADLERLPKELLGELVTEAAENGSVLEVAEEPADIRNGFILDYGDIYENCTFEALMDQNIEELMDKVKEILFA